MAEKNSEQTGSDKIFSDEVRQHMRAARREFRESVVSLLPPEFVQHRRRARREMLLAWRGAIEAALERLEAEIE
jgi:hypothetical protein